MSASGPVADVVYFRGSVAIRGKADRSFEAVTERYRFEFDPDSILNWNDGPCLEYKSWKHRAELVNGRWIVAVQ
jgi:hypothetical protein